MEPSQTVRNMKIAWNKPFFAFTTHPAIREKAMGNPRTACVASPMRFGFHVSTVELLILFISFNKEIHMNTKTFLAVLAILGLVVSCAQLNPHPMDMASTVRNAKTSADHTALAKHYEDAAQEMRLKAQQHKQQLEEYEKHSYYYGKRAQD